MPASLQEAYEAALAAKPAHVQAMRDAQHPGLAKDPVPMPPGVPERFEVEEREIAGFPVQVLHPRERGSGTQVVYFHGGAFTLPFQESHGRIVLGLADRTGADLWIPHYLPAPDGTIEDALPFIDALPGLSRRSRPAPAQGPDPDPHSYSYHGAERELRPPAC